MFFFFRFCKLLINNKLHEAKKEASVCKNFRWRGG